VPIITEDRPCQYRRVALRILGNAVLIRWTLGTATSPTGTAMAVQ